MNARSHNFDHLMWRLMKTQIPIRGFPKARASHSLFACTIHSSTILSHKHTTNHKTTINHENRHFRLYTTSRLGKTKEMLTSFFMGKQKRSLKFDDILALFSWVFFGNTLFILLGTTTFVSIVLFLSESLQFQEYVANLVRDYICDETGMDITFESAIVPKWKQGVIRLDNVRIRCNGKSWIEYLRRRHQKLSPNTEFNEKNVDVNWTYWDITVKSVDVTLSLWRWLEGRGIVTECKMNGVRGGIERRHVTWPDNWTPKLRSPQQGDFELDRFTVDDLLLTIYNPNFRPYIVSIFKAELPKLRQQWLLYDIICADSIVGTFDQCLFSVHKPNVSRSVDDKLWSKLSHLKISGVPIHHLNSYATGPFGWITNGNLDIDLHFMLPRSNQDTLMEKVSEELIGIKESVKEAMVESIEGQNPTEQDKDAAKHLALDELEKEVHMLWNVKIKDLKASIPLLTPEVSILNQAVIQPVVSFMNANKTSIPISFEANMKLKNFNGARTLYDSQLISVLSTQVGASILAKFNSEKQQAVNKKLWQAGLWNLNNMARNVIEMLDFSMSEEMKKRWEFLDFGWDTYARAPV